MAKPGTLAGKALSKATHIGARNQARQFIAGSNLREVLAAEETRRKTDLAAAFRFLNSVQKRKAVVFLISDFMAEGYMRELRVTARKHDVICCHISDPRESDLTDVGLIEIQDPETNELMLVDTSSKNVRNTFREHAEREHSELRATFRKFKIDNIPLSTARAFIDDIHKLFRQRQIRAGRG